MYTHFQKPIVINGNGTSLWGQSRGQFHITKYKICGCGCSDIDELDKNERFFGNLTIKGTDIDWYQYTDRLIEKEVNELMSPIISTLVNRHVKIGWSEQGMQPNKGWNFDAYEVKKKK